MKKLVYVLMTATMCASAMVSAKEPMQMNHQMMKSDSDVTYVKGMIEHHKAALAMSEEELKHGKDPKIKALARSIIKSQQQEIKNMQMWLNQHTK